MGLLKDFQYHAPSSLKEALSLLKASEDPLVLGGGTFVLNYLKKALKAPADVISLKKITGLGGLKDSPGNLAIGAMTTISELLESEIMRRHFSSFYLACQKLATTPIRNMATVGGNIASRFFWVDLPAVLISLDAKITFMTLKGEETTGIDEFLVQKPFKKLIITSVTLPKRNLITHYFRHTKTMEVDTPSLALAFSAVSEKSRLLDVRLVVNTTLSFPVRLKATEKFFENQDVKKISMDSVRAALKKDMEKSKLDEYRLGYLKIDIENLVNSL